MGVLSREKQQLYSKKGVEHIFEGGPIFEITVYVSLQLTSTKLALMYSAPVTPVGLRRVRDRLSVTLPMREIESSHFERHDTKLYLQGTRSS